MAFLDFVKNREAEHQKLAQGQPAERQQPQTAREIYARKDAQKKANQKPISPAVKAQAERYWRKRTVNTAL